jgi:hypothetical protein
VSYAHDESVAMTHVSVVWWFEYQQQRMMMMMTMKMMMLMLLQWIPESWVPVF